jgi:hypothetical protein
MWLPVPCSQPGLIAIAGQQESAGSRWSGNDVMVFCETKPKWKFNGSASTTSSSAQGGSDFDRDRLMALCPPCHAQTDAPYPRGRLVITPLGAGRFTAEVARGADKWAIRV